MKELIEKAEKLDREATPGPWDTYENEITAGDNLLFKAGHRSQATAYDMLFVSQARTLLPALAAELRKLTAPRPIAEAPRDGTWVLLPFSTSKWDACRGPSPQYVTARWFAAAWADPNGALLTEPSHYLPLPDVKP